jgi:predicted nuclease of restriction endonuclease-like RecB superfamily
MLPATLVRVRHSRNRLLPQYLDPGAQSWRDIAEPILELYRGSAGVTRGELEAELKELIGNHPGQLVFRGLARLLEDRCDFGVVSGHPPPELREKVFAAAALRRLAGTFNRDQVLEQVAGDMGLSVPVIEEGMFADLKSQQRVVKFEDINVTQLIERYNVALAQSILLRSSGVTVTLRNETSARLRQVFRAQKFHRLMCDAEQPSPGTTRLRLDGPLSLFSSTQKYGLQLALFLPTLLQCKNFEIEAQVRWGTQRKEKILVITTADGLVSHLPDHASLIPPELEMFAELFRKKVPDWELSAEADVLPLGRGWWAPDFRLTHQATGRSVYLEILGYWRRRAAEKHLERLREFAGVPFLLAVSSQLKIDEDDLAGFPAGIHTFRAMPQPDEVARLASEVLKTASPQ